MDKQTVRAQMRQKRRCLTLAQRRLAGEELARRLAALPVYRRASCVYGYLSCHQEAPTLPILAQAQRDGKQIAVPKVADGKMRFILLEDLSAIAPGYKGIPEPVADAPVAENRQALVLLPGLAFDRQGRRIGYGGGFYDRFLAAEPEHPTVALAYDFQLYEALPAESHDIPADIVLTAPVGELSLG